MKVILAATSGFCMGVKRAMQMAIDTAKSSKNKVYTLGALIHNPQAVEFLSKCGVQTLNSHLGLKSGTIIIRAHGVPKYIYDELKNQNIDIVDATCPHVLASQKKIKSYSDQGYQIALIGDPNHPEIISLQSFAEDFILISNKEDAIKASFKDKVMVISQTTYNAEQFNEIADEICRKNPKTVVCNSICMATHHRQQEIRELASKVDAVVVVGGRNSANTGRLAQIASSLCNSVQLIETEKELNLHMLKGCSSVAVTAGASTPDFVTNKVIETLKNI